jgi:hypothetical protein
MTTLIGSLLHFLMSGLLAAGIAKLLRLQPLRMLLLILRGGVIAILAVTTLQRNNFPHFSNPFLKSAGRLSRPASENYLYSTISVTAPAPTVWPPSRIAKRKPFSKATGVISVTSQLTLSPGITISTPAGNFMSPVTSVVRK